MGRIDTLTAPLNTPPPPSFLLPPPSSHQARMAKENGIEATVDHLHRTIYGALLAGRTFKWMKHGASRSPLVSSKGGGRGEILHRAAPSQHREQGMEAKGGG